VITLFRGIDERRATSAGRAKASRRRYD